VSSGQKDVGNGG